MIRIDTVRRNALLMAAVGAFDAVTLCWIVWGLLTPGDFFAHGNPFVLVTLPAALIAGAWLGSKARTRARRISLSAVGILCAVFWLFAPNGWWASGPPGPAVTTRSEIEQGMCSRALC